MIPKTAQLVTPEPYFKIAFGCSNRAFYDVKNELYAIANSINIEIQDGYIEEKCDYEGDLEEIRIYNNKRGTELVSAVLNFYKIPLQDMPENADLALTIF